MKYRSCLTRETDWSAGKVIGEQLFIGYIEFQLMQ